MRLPCGEAFLLKDGTAPALVIVRFTSCAFFLETSCLARTSTSTRRRSKASNKMSASPSALYRTQYMGALAFYKQDKLDEAVKEAELNLQ